MNEQLLPDDEAKRLMQEYYKDLMAKPVPEAPVMHPRFTAAEAESREYETVNHMRQSVGLPPLSNRQGRRIQTAVSLTDTELDNLRSLAQEWGYMHGGRGNISAFVAAIAMGDFELRPRYEGR